MPQGEPWRAGSVPRIGSRRSNAYLSHLTFEKGFKPAIGITLPKPLSLFSDDEARIE